MNQSDYDALSIRVWAPVALLAALSLGVGLGGVIGSTWGFGASLMLSGVLGAAALLFMFIAQVVLRIVREGYEVEGGA